MRFMEHLVTTLLCVATLIRMDGSHGDTANHSVAYGIQQCLWRTGSADGDPHFYFYAQSDADQYADTDEHINLYTDGSALFHEHTV
jgi:hypothetical protein